MFSSYYRTLLSCVVTLGVFAQPLLSQCSYQKGASKAANVFDELQHNTWYLPTSDHQAKLYVTTLGGNGPLIVCLHGGPGNDFNYLVQPLRPHRAHYRFELFDQRGSLLSPVADSLVHTLSMDMLVEDLETLRKALGQEQILVFGHSFGTYLALSYYIKYPQHVKGMVLAACLPPFTTPSHTLSDVARDMSRVQRILRQRPEVKKVMHDAGIDTTSGAHLTPQQASTYFKIDGLASFNIYQIEKWKQFEGGRVSFHSKVSNAIGNTMQDIYDIRPSLQSHPVPIYVLQGDHDYVDPSAKSWTAIRDLFPSIHVMVLPKASHYSWIDDPALFQQNLQLALQSLTKK
jgi:proline iminopeptidase